MIVSAAEDTGWRNAAKAALDGCAVTLVELAPASVLDPGCVIVLVWTAHAALHPDLARRLIADREDLVVWRPDDAPAPDWMAHAYPVGPGMPARTLRTMVRFARAESARVVVRAPRKSPRRRKRRAIAAPVLSLLALLAAAGALLAWQWPRAPAAAAAPPEGLRGLQ